MILKVLVRFLLYLCIKQDKSRGELRLAFNMGLLACGCLNVKIHIKATDLKPIKISDIGKNRITKSVHVQISKSNKLFCLYGMMYVIVEYSVFLFPLQLII